MGRHHMRSQRHKRRWHAELNTMQRVLVGVSKLQPADVQRQRQAMQAAIEGLLAGHPGSDCWKSMADAANIAETLASMGIGGGPEAEQVIADAQEVLAYMAQEHASRGTWALHAAERDEVRHRLLWLASVHGAQLEHCSYGEFDRAYQATRERVSQARAGNAPAGAIVVEGLIQ